MLGGGEYISALINLLIAGYLIFAYPNTVQRQFRNRPLPPFFRMLYRGAPIAGVLLAAGTTLYLLLRLFG